MKNRLVALIAAVVVGMSLVPPVASAEDAEAAGFAPAGGAAAQKVEK